MQILETERLIVRKLSEDDAAFMLELLNEPAFLRYIGDRGVRSQTDSKTYLQNGALASYERFGFGLWLVALKTSLEPLGICGLVKRDGLEDVDIGYAFLARFCSRGYASEAAAAVKDYGLRVLGLPRLVGITDPENLASAHILEKIGLKFERMVRLSQDDIELKLFSTDG